MNFFLLLLLLTHLTTINTLVEASNVTSAYSGKGSMAEFDQDLEMLMESETSRRFLVEQKKYITPGTMKRDQPVCNGVAPGAPYTSGGRCVPEKSNTYKRGCSTYYRCKPDS